jgi:hypothetical protein
MLRHTHLHESGLVLIDHGGFLMVRVHRCFLHVRPQLVVVPTLWRLARLHNHSRGRVHGCAQMLGTAVLLGIALSCCGAPLMRYP